MIDTFAICQQINNHLLNDNEPEARNLMIKLLDQCNEIRIQDKPLVNHLIRETGLYPYFLPNCSWEERYINELFKTDCGYEEPITLHREQSFLLKQLLEGENIVVSAPTSFGKSFIIDSFISIKKPTNVVIIVPTIALTDETRRRLYKKFSDDYKIITTSEASLEAKNILIFPQERALKYIGVLNTIDILIIDEFYKISSTNNKFDDERIPSLYKAIFELSKIAKQRYFLTPNIKAINENFITADMSFIDKLDFNTVVLEEHNLFDRIQSEQDKGDELLKILTNTNGKSNISKTLIYAGTHNETQKVATLLVDKLSPPRIPVLLKAFSEWLKTNYFSGWELPLLIERGVGIHNGQIHRSLCQIQLKLFEEENGLNTIISTSSIIEGVNTSAENVVIWRNKIGRYNLNDFTYKNIIGRGGRMFKYFIGKVYLLDKTPVSKNNELDISFPEKLLGNYDETTIPEGLSTEQKVKNDKIRNDIIRLISVENYKKIFKGNMLQIADNIVALKIIESLKSDNDWNGLSFLLSSDTQTWDRLIYKIISLRPEWWEVGYATLVEFIKVLSTNWERTIPELLDELDDYQVTIQQFFQLERIVSFKFSSILNDINVLYPVCREDNVDISPFIYKTAYAFMPKIVYQLEEYGLPRMLSRKIVDAHIMNMEDEALDIYSVISQFKQIGFEKFIKSIRLTEIEEYILKYFYDGISINKKNPIKNEHYHFMGNNVDE
jgi:hypothetical protein